MSRSAVDSHVSKFLFREMLQGYLSGKTRVLVTHQLQYLSQVDYVIMLKDGIISEQGTFSQLMAQQGEFSRLMVCGTVSDI